VPLLTGIASRFRGLRLAASGEGPPEGHYESVATLLGGPGVRPEAHLFRPSSPHASRHSNIWFQVPGSSVLARVALGESGPEALFKGSWRGPTTSAADRHRLAGIAVPSDQAASQSPRPLVGNGETFHHHAHPHCSILGTLGAAPTRDRRHAAVPPARMLQGKFQLS
jgi:hypothetical protein